MRVISKDVIVAVVFKNIFYVCIMCVKTVIRKSRTITSIQVHCLVYDLPSYLK